MAQQAPTDGSCIIPRLPPPPFSPSLVLAFLHDLTSRADLVQAHVLSSILRRNARTEYLRRVVRLPAAPAAALHKKTPPDGDAAGGEGRDGDGDGDGGDGDRDAGDAGHGDGGSGDGADDRDLCSAYRKLAPLVAYEDLQPFIQRIADGDASPILCADPITEFLTSSGTSGGERKLMPMTEDDWARRRLVYSLLLPVISQYVEGLFEEGAKGMYFMLVKEEGRTRGGLPARPALTSLYKSEAFVKQEEGGEEGGGQYTSPIAGVVQCPDVGQSMYCQLLCGLRQRHRVVRAGAVFASGFLRALALLRARWPDLVRDLADGAVNAAIVTDPAARRAVVSSPPGPDGDADLVASECRKPSWRGIVRRLWPRAMYVDAIVTGSMAQYVPALDFYTDRLPIVSTVYASSECYFGINLAPLSPPSAISYTLLPNMAYFEFLPTSPSPSPSPSPGGGGGGEPLLREPRAEDLVPLADVELGKEYELVITTYTGLYRYRVGDMLRVTGFHNKAPRFEFVCRRNVVLSVESDKTDEETLLRAIKAAAGKHLDGARWQVAEYTSYADLTTSPGHYVLFWELARAESEPEASSEAAITVDELSSVLEDCCLAVEEGLDSVYRQGRVSDKSIGPLEVRVVAPGTFDALMDYCVANGSSMNQYKTPRCVKHAPIVQLLDSRVTHRFFSPRLPHWAPGQRPQI